MMEPPACADWRMHSEDEQRPHPDGRYRSLRSRLIVGPSHLSRNVAVEREEEPHRLVAGIGGRSEHARAPAVDHGDAVRAPVPRCRFGDAAGSGAAMHPDVLDPELKALAHRCLGVLGPGRDHHCLDAAGNGAQIVVGGVAFDVVGVWIDCEDVVAADTQPIVADIAARVPRLSRNAGDGDALVPKKLSGGILDCGHVELLTGIVKSVPLHPLATKSTQ